MLRVEDVRLVWGSFALHADFTLEPGSRAAVVGPSGAGKSTLLDLIAGFLLPDAGRILWMDRDLTQLTPDKRPVSMIFQENNLFPHLTVEQNVGLGVRPDLKLSPEERKQVEKSLERVGLGGLGRRRPVQLSGGQRGRVALARVLLRARPILLLDEPFAALGPALRREMLALVQEVAGETGATVLMVSHEPGDALALADKTITVFDGQVSAPRETAALFADPPPELQAYLG